MRTQTDESLMVLIRKGDELAASVLYHRYVDWVYRICWRVLLNDAQAKDCTQEVWIKVFGKADKFDPDKSFKSWLSSIAVRTAIDQYRKKSRNHQVCFDDSTEASLISNFSTGREQLEEERVYRVIHGELSKLSAPQRVAFTLRHFEGWSVVEISQILDCSEGTVKSHIHRAVQVVRKKLTRYLQVEGRESCPENG